MLDDGAVHCWGAAVAGDQNSVPNVINLRMVAADERHNCVLDDLALNVGETIILTARDTKFLAVC